MSHSVSVDDLELAGRWGADARTLLCVSDAANRVYRCESDDGLLYLRVTTTASRALELVAAAVDWQRQLHNAGAPVVQPLCSSDGFWIEMASGGQVVATATRAAPGRPVDFSNLLETAAWAEAVGLVHAASERYAPSFVSTRAGTIRGRLPTLDDLWKQIEPAVMDDPPLRERYMEGSEFLDRQTEPLLVTHGDVRPGNTSVFNGRVTLLDFDEPTPAWAPYDLARMMLDDDARPPDDSAGHFAAIREGYLRGRPAARISEDDVEQLVRIRVVLMHAWSLQDPSHSTEAWLHQLRSLLRSPLSL